MLADFVNLHDSRMLKPSDCLCLVLNARQDFLTGHAAGEQHLQSNHAIENLLPCSKDDRHSAATNLFEQVVSGRRFDSPRVVRQSR